MENYYTSLLEAPLWMLVRKTKTCEQIENMGTLGKRDSSTGFLKIMIQAKFLHIGEMVFRHNTAMISVYACLAE